MDKQQILFDAGLRAKFKHRSRFVFYTFHNKNHSSILKKAIVFGPTRTESKGNMNDLNKNNASDSNKRQRAKESAPRNIKKRNKTSEIVLLLSSLNNLFNLLIFTANNNQNNDFDFHADDNNDEYDEPEGGQYFENKEEDSTLVPLINETNDGGSKESIETRDVSALVSRQDSDWNDRNLEDSMSNDEPVDVLEEQQPVEEEEVEQPRNISTRVLRSAVIAASVPSNGTCDRAESDIIASNLAQEENRSVWELVALNCSVDAEHRQLLIEYNHSVANLAKLRHYLRTNSHESQSLYLHMCEDAVILQRQAELLYLSTAEAYQALDASMLTRDAYVCKPIPVDLLKAHNRKVVKGTTVIDGKDDNGKWPVAEIVGEWIEDALKGEKDQRLPYDANYPVHGDVLNPEEGVSTVKAFLRDFDSTCAVNNMSHKAKLGLLDTLHRNIPSLRLGIRASLAGNNVHDYSKYMLKDWRDVTVDVCPSHCALFIGENRWKIKCPCGEYRYSKCGNNGNCKKGGIDCDPFETPTHNARSSFNVLKYR